MNVISRTSKTYNILFALKEASLTFHDLCIVVVSMPYGSSYRRLSHALERRISMRHQESTRESALSFQERRTFSSILSRLKKDGLIATTRQESTRYIKITPRGVKKLGHFAMKKYSDTPPRPIYPKEKGREVILIMFDIPERQKHKRAWLRRTLEMLEFRILQKSVWIGTTKIPGLFLDDLKQYGILPYVEILAITKSGTLKDVASQAKESAG